MLFRVDFRVCALPLEQVAEVMRPLPMQPLAGMPPFVLGLSIIRGAATPVVHAGRLLGSGEASPPTRFLSLQPGRVALAVDSVIGVRDLTGVHLDELPPALDASGFQVIAAVGTLDSEVLVMLRSAPFDQLWTDVARGLVVEADAEAVR
jgi:purine-binding chemotaxis protein CheW